MPAPFSVWLHAVNTTQTSTPEIIFFMPILPFTATAVVD
ncbi:hypothetical protein SZ54_2304 [Rhizobium sp. UR51a]|nr:hypothetical protein SZ54_2304 [Rhizobium sp. UR51a]